MFQERDDGRFPAEAAVLDDIRYFETRIALLEETGRQNAAAVQVHRLQLRQRRQLLAAIRDGAPERWRDYAFMPPDTDSCG